MKEPRVKYMIGSLMIESQNIFLGFLHLKQGNHIIFVLSWNRILIAPIIELNKALKCLCICPPANFMDVMSLHSMFIDALRSIAPHLASRLVAIQIKYLWNFWEHNQLNTLYKQIAWLMLNKLELAFGIDFLESKFEIWF